MTIDNEEPRIGTDEHQERVREISRDSARRHADIRRAYAMRPDRQARRRNLAKRHRRYLREQFRVWAAKNIERLREKERRRRLNDAPRRAASDRIYRLRHPKRYRDSIERTKAAKPDLYRAIGQDSARRRRARKAGCVIEPVSATRIVARDHQTCHLCGRFVRKPDRTLDHLIPVVRRGADAEWNLALAHDRCNKRRGTKQILQEETQAAAEAYIALHVARAEAA